MKNPYKNSLSKGFSLIEILIVIAVIAVIALAAFLIYPIARDRIQAKQEADNIRSIQANVRSSFFLKNGSYAGLGNGQGAGNGPDRGVANLARAYPVSMNGGDYSRNVEIRSSWGGDVWVWARPEITTPKGPVGHNKSFGIAYEGVPQRVCLPLIMSVAENFVSVSINGVEIQTANGPDRQAAIRACSGSTQTSYRLSLTSI